MLAQHEGLQKMSFENQSEYSTEDILKHLLKAFEIGKLKVDCYQNKALACKVYHRQIIIAENVVFGNESDW